MHNRNPKGSSTEHHFETPEALRHDARTLAESARGLIEATSQIADEKVKEARERLAEAVERGQLHYQELRQKTIEGAKAADETIRTHPYHAATIALGVGALIGALLARRR